MGMCIGYRELATDTKLVGKGHQRYEKTVVRPVLAWPAPRLRGHVSRTAAYHGLMMRHGPVVGELIIATHVNEQPQRGVITQPRVKPWDTFA